MSATFRGNRLECGVHSCGITELLRIANKTAPSSESVSGAVSTDTSLARSTLDIQEFVNNVSSCKLLIDGKLMDSLSGEYFVDRSPLTGLIQVEKLPRAGLADADMAVEAARRCFNSKEWRNLNATKRALAIHGIIDILKNHSEELILLQASDSGTPVQACKADVECALTIYEHYLTSFVQTLSQRPVEFNKCDNDNLQSYFSYKPIGVIVALLSWRSPLSILALILCPCLLCGNSIVIKVCESCPLVSLKFAQLLVKMNLFPAGLVNFITGKGHHVGEHLICNKDVDKVVFYGQSRILKLVKEMCSRLRPVKPLLSDLCGKATAIVLAEANIDETIEQIVFSAFDSMSALIPSIRVDKILVPDILLDSFMEKLKIATEILASRKGDPFDINTRVGPMSSKDAFHNAIVCIEKCLENGALLITGGTSSANALKILPDPLKLNPIGVGAIGSKSKSDSDSDSYVKGLHQGMFIQPTIFDCRHLLNEDEALNEENGLPVFCLEKEMIGPTVCLFAYDSEDLRQAANRAARINTSRYAVVFGSCSRGAEGHGQGSRSQLIDLIQSDVVAINSLNCTIDQTSTDKVINFYATKKYVIDHSISF